MDGNRELRVAAYLVLSYEPLLESRQVIRSLTGQRRRDGIYIDARIWCVCPSNRAVPVQAGPSGGSGQGLACLQKCRGILCLSYIGPETIPRQDHLAGLQDLLVCGMHVQSQALRPALRNLKPAAQLGSNLVVM